MQVVGQTADLFDLQRILARSANKLGDAAQQNVTRWAVYSAASLLNKHAADFDALREAMKSGASVPECVRAIEAA